MHNKNNPPNKWFYFTQKGIGDLRRLVKRDKNQNIQIINIIRIKVDNF